MSDQSPLSVIATFEGHLALMSFSPDTWLIFRLVANEQGKMTVGVESVSRETFVDAYQRGIQPAMGFYRQFAVSSQERWGGEGCPFHRKIASRMMDLAVAVPIEQIWGIAANYDGETPADLRRESLTELEVVVGVDYRYRRRRRHALKKAIRHTPPELLQDTLSLIPESCLLIKSAVQFRLASARVGA